MTMNMQPTHLQNEWIKLVPVQAGDFDTLFNLASDPLVWEQHPEQDRYKSEVFQRFFDTCIASGSGFVVYDAKTGEPIGSSRYYDHSPEKRSVGIGYTFLARSRWGGPYNRALKELMINYALEHADVVTFHIGALNMRSQKAVEKLGAKKIEERDDESGLPVNRKCTYELTRHDWEENIKNRSNGQSILQ